MNRRIVADSVVFALLVAVGVASRLLQDYTSLLPPNFHAIVATTMFAGFYFRHRATAVGVSVVSMILSDLVLGGYDGGVMVTVYTALALPVVWRTFLRHTLSPGRLGISAVVSSVVFYLTTNFAVWFCWSAMYSWTSLIRCYTVALPFFGYTLAGDLLYSTALFGAYVLVRKYSPASDVRAAMALQAA